MRVNLFWFTDEQWVKVKPHLPTNQPGPERKDEDDRRILSGIMHVVKTECRWEDCPPEYGPHKTIYNRFNRWSGRGICQNIYEAVAQSPEPPERVALDSTQSKPIAAPAAETYGPPVVKWFFSAGMNSLHKRIRPFGYASAKMEIRAFQSS
jgi:transposase